MSEEVNENNLLVDKVALDASSTWLLNNKNNYNDKHHYSYIFDSLTYLQDVQYLNELKQPIPISSQVNNSNNNIPLPNFFKITTFVRLLLLFALFRRGYKGKYMVLYIIGGILFYIYDCGLAKYLITVFVNRRLQRRQLVNSPNATVAVNAANLNDNGNGPIIPQQIQQPQDLLDVLYNVSQNGVAIPMNPGILYDVLSFMIGFVCSLFPAWQPLQQ